jgi:hypothetical protein
MGLDRDSWISQGLLVRLAPVSLSKRVTGSGKRCHGIVGHDRSNFLVSKRRNGFAARAFGLELY